MFTTMKYTIEESVDLTTTPKPVCPVPTCTTGFKAKETEIEDLNGCLVYKCVSIYGDHCPPPNCPDGYDVAYLMGHTVEEDFSVGENNDHQASVS